MATMFTSQSFPKFRNYNEIFTVKKEKKKKKGIRGI